MIFRRLRIFPRNKWLRRILTFFLVFILMHIMIITIDGLYENTQPADIAIVLGNRANEDGSLASWTKGRVDKALELYREKKVKRIFVSGGLSIETNYPEGKAMKAYLVQQGVSAEHVIEDNLGNNTYLTAKNFIEVNRDSGYQSAIIVSQFYHVTRSKYILRKVGFTGSIQDASSENYEWKDIIGTLREVPAFYKYMMVY